jgi:hypothetical protein
MENSTTSGDHRKPVLDGDRRSVELGNREFFKGFPGVVNALVIKYAERRRLAEQQARFVIGPPGIGNAGAPPARDDRLAGELK